MKLSKMVLLLFCVFLSFSCSKKSKGPAPVVKEEETGGTYLKWVLKRSGEQVTPIELKKLDLPYKIVPQVVGDHLVIATAQEKKIAAYPFQFPTRWHSETVSAEGRRGSSYEPIEGDVFATVIMPMKDSFDKLAVMDTQGKIVLETSALSDGQKIKEIAIAKMVAPATPEKPKAGRFGCQFYPTRPAFYRHIQALMPEDLELLPYQGQRLIQEIVPTEEALWSNDVITEFNQMAPGPLSAVTHIAFARYKPETQNHLADAFGSTMIINVDKIAARDFPGTIIHEAAHNYEELLSGFIPFHPIEAGRRAVTGQRGHWPPELITLAQQTLLRLGLSFYQTFGGLWDSMNESALKFDLTIPYKGDDGWGSATQEEVLGFGFASKYGTRNQDEDIAEFVLYVQGASLVGEPAVCQRLRTAGRNFNTTHILPYVKILMLKGAGFITEERARACYGDVIIEGEEGIHLLGQNMQPVLSFTSGVKAGFQRDRGDKYFSVLGNGPNTYQILIQLFQDGGRITPMGLYRLASINMTNVNTPQQNGLYLSHQNSLKARTSSDGLVLISEATPQKVQGAIFFLGLWGAKADVMVSPMGLPVPVPLPGVERYPVVTFRHEP